MARRYFIYKVLPLGASCFLNNINVACGDGFPVQLGNEEGVWGGDGREIYLYIKYCWKAPFWSLIFLQKHMLNIGCNTPRWDLC